jgi:hypothetical protein
MFLKVVRYVRRVRRSAAHRPLVEPQAAQVPAATDTAACLGVWADVGYMVLEGKAAGHGHE